MTPPRHRALARVLTCAALLAAGPVLVAPPLGHTHGTPAAAGRAERVVGGGGIPHATTGTSKCVVCAVGPRAAALAYRIAVPLGGEVVVPVAVPVLPAIVDAFRILPAARGPPALLLDA